MLFVNDKDAVKNNKRFESVNGRVKNSQIKIPRKNFENRKIDIFQISVMAPRRRKRSKFKLKLALKNIWIEFCQFTTFLGFRYIGGRRHVEGVQKFVWIIIWLSQFVCFFYLSWRLFDRYFQYEVKTSTTYIVSRELSFPAVTICNVNMFKRSVIGSHKLVMFAIAKYFAPSDISPKVFETFLAQTNETCYSDNEFDINELKTFAQSMDIVARDADDDVIECQWNNRRVDCKKLFFNHLTDYGWCYTFNRDPSLDGKENTSSAYLLFGGYGTEENTARYVQNNAAPFNGLQLLLNTGQHDYCGIGRKYVGAGLYMQIHDPSAEATFLTTSSISLSPGYDHSVTVHPVVFDRRTEELGRCLKSMKFKLYPNFAHYFRMACWGECVIERIYKECGCFPPNFVGSEEQLMALGLTKSTATVCSFEQFTCMHFVADETFVGDVARFCPTCRVPCYETFYESLASRRRLLSPFKATSGNDGKSLLQRNVTIVSKRTHEEIRKNYATLKVFFSRMNALIVVETQAFTKTDLATSFGWTLGLFLGGSFLSPYEIIHSCLLSITTLWRHLKGNRRRRIKDTP